MALINSIPLLTLSVLGYFIPTCCFLPSKLTLKQKAGFFCILLVNLFFMMHGLGNAGVVFLLLSSYIYFALIFKNRLLNICAFIAIYLFCVLCDHVFSLFWNTLISSFSNFQTFTMDYFLYVLLYVTLMAIICPPLGKLTHRFTIKIIFGIPKQVLALITANLLVCLFIFLFNIIVGQYIGYSDKIITFNCILFGCYCIISTVLIVNLLKTHMTKIELDMRQESYERLQEYTHQVEEMYSSLRSFKHDYQNIMLSMSGYIEAEDIKGLQTYFHNEILPQSQSLSKNTAQLNQLMNLKVTELKSIVSSKLLYAIELHIAVTIEMTEEISEISVDALDLSRVLGIFLDNAIETALETEHPSIRFAAISLDTEYLFIISNTYIDHGLSLASLRQPLISSKGTTRGIGLYNAQKILSKYPGVLWNTAKDETSFAQQLNIAK